MLLQAAVNEVLGGYFTDHWRITDQSWPFTRIFNLASNRPLTTINDQNHDQSHNQSTNWPGYWSRLCQRFKKRKYESLLRLLKNLRITDYRDAKLASICAWWRRKVRLQNQYVNKQINIVTIFVSTIILKL